jgi:hypothetical protein
MLDLGRVRDIAEVVVNGKSVATVWTPPFRVDITDAVKAGDNQVQIKVTNEWTNRIAGDAANPEQRVLSGGGRRGGRGFGGRGGAAGPPESGLIGPVTVLAESTK